MTPYFFSVFKKKLALKLLSERLPIYVINEFPKSGGTWLKNMLADALGVTAWTREKSAFQSCVMLTHSMSTDGAKPIILFRDGRDVMVSFYFHSFFYNDVLNSSHVDLMRKELNFKDYNDVKGNLLEFMKRIHSSPVSPLFSWVEFVDEWAGRDDIIQTSYEALRLDTATELSRIVAESTKNMEIDEQHISEIVKKYSFENVKSNGIVLHGNIEKKQAAERVFARKGSVGGWEQYFTEDSIVWFESIAKNQLKSLGYTLHSVDDLA